MTPAVLALAAGFYGVQAKAVRPDGDLYLASTMSSGPACLPPLAGVTPLTSRFVSEPEVGLEPTT